MDWWNRCDLKDTHHKMGSQTISLNWSNHRKNMSSVFQHLFSIEAFVDVTLACEGFHLKAHKIVLSASSQFFQTLLLENPCQHPIVILTDMRYNDLTEIVNFMYQGMIDISQDRLSEFLKTAERLKIKGLSMDSRNERYNSKLAEKQFVPHSSKSQPQCDITQFQTNYNNEQFLLHRNETSSTASFETDAMPQPMPPVKLEGSAEIVKLVEPELLAGNEIRHPLSLHNYCAISHAFNQVNGNNEAYISNQHNDCSYSIQQETSIKGLTFPEGYNIGADCQLFTPIFTQQKRLELEDRETFGMHRNRTEVPELNNNYSDNSIPVKDMLNESEEGKVERNYLLTAIEPQTTEAEEIIDTVQNNDNISSKEDPSLCDICGKTFESIRNLSRHVRTHITDQQFSCATCNKTFLHKSSLRHHFRTHSGERPFSCEICSRSFVQREHLRTHLRIHSGEKPFACIVCNKRFITKNHLTIHSRSHTGERPYACDICEKCYTKSSDLVSHIRAHTGEKPFKCSICNKSFVQNSALKVHAMRVHYRNS